MINDGLLVKVRTRDAGEIIGVLVDTHLIPQQQGPSMGLDAQKKLVQTGPGQVQLKLFALVAHPRGFTFGPISDVMPLFPEEFPIPGDVIDGEPAEVCSGCDNEHGECECPYPEQVDDAAAKVDGCPNNCDGESGRCSECPRSVAKEDGEPMDGRPTSSPPDGGVTGRVN